MPGNVIISLPYKTFKYLFLYRFFFRFRSNEGYWLCFSCLLSPLPLQLLFLLFFCCWCYFCTCCCCRLCSCCLWSCCCYWCWLVSFTFVAVAANVDNAILLLIVLLMMIMLMIVLLMIILLLLVVVLSQNQKQQQSVWLNFIYVNPSYVLALVKLFCWY